MALSITQQTTNTIPITAVVMAVTLSIGHPNIVVNRATIAAIEAEAPAKPCRILFVLSAILVIFSFHSVGNKSESTFQRPTDIVSIKINFFVFFSHACPPYGVHSLIAFSLVPSVFQYASA